MDRNLLLAIALSLVVLSTWSMWQESQFPDTTPRGVDEGTHQEPAALEDNQLDYLELPPGEPVAPPIPSTLPERRSR